MSRDPIRCASNLGPRQSARRLAMGLVTLAAAAIGLAIMVHRDLPGGARLALFPVWWAGMAGILEARGRT